MMKIIAHLFALLFSVAAQAQSLDGGQLAILKAHISASSDLNSQPNNTDGDYEIARLLNLSASPAYIVWRTNVSREEIYNLTSAEATTWSWQFYKNQSVTEQNSWTQMFMGDRANFAQPNLRAGVSNIFTAGSAVNATHAFAVAKRQAKRGEKLFSTGIGTTAAPATMAREGDIGYADVRAARNLP